MPRANLKRRGKRGDGRGKQMPEPFGEDERRQKRDKTTVMRMGSRRPFPKPCN